MAIIVQRLPGDKPGPNICTFLSLPSSLLEIGRQEINQNGENVLVLSLQTISNDFREPGEIVQILYGGLTLYGMVTSFNSTVAVTKKALNITTTVTVEVPSKWISRSDRSLGTRKNKGKGRSGQRIYVLYQY